MTTPDGKPYGEVVRDLVDAGLVTVADDGVVEVVPTDWPTVFAVLKRLGAAHRAEAGALGGPLGGGDGATHD